MPTNFLWYSGSTPYNGILTTASVTVVSTEMVNLASSTVTIGASTITSSWIGQAIWGEVFIQNGSSTSAPASGANWAGWFMPSTDGGTTFESTANFNPGPPRAPDFLIPSSTLAQASGSWVKAQGLIRLPATPFKVAIQNNLSVAFSTTGTPALVITPIAMQY